EPERDDAQQPEPAPDADEPAEAAAQQAVGLGRELGPEFLGLWSGLHGGSGSGWRSGAGDGLTTRRYRVRAAAAWESRRSRVARPRSAGSGCGGAGDGSGVVPGGGGEGLHGPGTDGASPAIQTRRAGGREGCEDHENEGVVVRGAVAEVIDGV